MTETMQTGEVAARPPRVDPELIEPPPSEPLASSLSSLLGRPISVEVRWIQTSIGPSEAAPTTTQAPTTTPANGELADVRPVVEEWLAAGTITSGPDEVSDIAINDDEVTVDVVGPSAPPLIDALTANVSKVLNRDVKITVRWSQRVVVGQPTENTTVAAVEKIAAIWVGNRTSVVIASAQVTASGVTVEITARIRHRWTISSPPSGRRSDRLCRSTSTTPNVVS